MGPGLTRNLFLEIRPKKPYTSSDILKQYTMCILSVLLKVVGYYDLIVLSMSVMGLQKKVWMGGWWVG